MHPHKGWALHWDETQLGTGQGLGCTKEELVKQLGDDLPIFSCGGCLRMLLG